MSTTRLVLWSEEQAAAYKDFIGYLYVHVWEPIDIPKWKVWSSAIEAAFVDSWQAALSTWHLVFMTFKPLVVLGYILLRYVLRLLWNYVVVQGISKQGVQYLITASRKFVQFHQQLTPKQLCIEGAILAGLMILYYIWKILQRNRMMQRCKAFVRKISDQNRQWSRRQQKRIVMIYDGAVRKIATTSLWLAVMTPHLLFFGAGAVTRVIVPSTIFTWLLRETAIIWILSVGYPLIATILLLYDHICLAGEINSKIPSKKLNVAAEEDDKENSNPNASNQKKIRAKKSSDKKVLSVLSPTSRTGSNTDATAVQPTTGSTRKRRRSLLSLTGLPYNETNHHECLKYWIEYWMFHASLQVSKKLLYTIPFLGSSLQRYRILRETFDLIELALYVWIYVIPIMMPNILNAPEARPLVMLAPIIRKTAVAVYSSFNFFSTSWWGRFVVRPTGMMLDFAVLIRLISTSNADECRQFISTGQSLLVPLASLMMPRMVSVYGLLFAQYVLPLHQSAISMDSDASAVVRLKYWVIHCILTTVLSSLASILWWIPLSSAIVFGIYVLLAWRASLVDSIVSTLIWDLKAFGLLPTMDGDELNNQSLEETFAVRGLKLLLSHLPSAKDEPENSEQSFLNNNHDPSSSIQYTEKSEHDKNTIGVPSVHDDLCDFNKANVDGLHDSLSVNESAVGKAKQHPTEIADNSSDRHVTIENSESSVRSKKRRGRPPKTVVSST